MTLYRQDEKKEKNSIKDAVGGLLRQGSVQFIAGACTGDVFGVLKNGWGILGTYVLKNAVQPAENPEPFTTNKGLNALIEGGTGAIGSAVTTAIGGYLLPWILEGTGVINPETAQAMYNTTNMMMYVNTIIGGAFRSVSGLTKAHIAGKKEQKASDLLMKMYGSRE